MTFRAFTPYPGAFVTTCFGHVRIGKAHMVSNLEPGPATVGQVRPDLVVGFLGGSIALLEVQPEGKKRMSGTDWANGARIGVGDCLSQ